MKKRARTLIVDWCWRNKVYPVEDRASELLDLLEAEGYMIVDMDDHDLTARLPQIAAARAMDRILSRGEF